MIKRNFLLIVLLGLGHLASIKTYAQQPTTIEPRIEAITENVCDTTRDEMDREIEYYVGGMYDFVIYLRPEGQRPNQVSYEGVTDWSWPEGLVITVAQMASPTAPFLPSPELRERLGLQYYVTDRQARSDSLWRATGYVPQVFGRTPEYHFSFQVPADLANSFLCFQVDWQQPRYGLLQWNSPYCMHVYDLCSDKARDLVWRSHVDAALDRREPDLAMARADSFITLGWRDLWGLALAKKAAMDLGRFDDAIRYLDLCFQANHALDPMLPPHPDTPPSAHEREGYEFQREQLLDMQQQQPQR